jgi:hypothetical protein
VAAVFRSQVGLVERYSDPGEQPGVALPACLACLSAVAFLWLPVPFPCRFCGSLLLPLCCACWALLRALCLLPCRLPGRAADEGQAHAGAGGRHTLQCGEAGGLPAAAAPVVPARLGTPAFRAVKARHAGPQPAPHSSSAASPLPHCACYAVPAMLCLLCCACRSGRAAPTAPAPFTTPQRSISACTGPEASPACSTTCCPPPLRCPPAAGCDACCCCRPHQPPRRRCTVPAASCQVGCN